MLDIWSRLYVHALLRESRIFPGVELHDETLDYLRYGYADLWKGDYRGEPVCVRAIRLRDPARLTDIKTVRDPSRLLRSRSVRIIAGILSCEQRGQASSQRAAHRRGFRDTVSALHHESMDDEWEHRQVYPGQRRCRSAVVSMCLSTWSLTKMTC